MRIVYLVQRVIKQIIGDKRTLALMLIAPLVILTLMNFIFNNSNNTNLKVGYYNLNSSIVTSLNDNDITTVKFDDNSNINSKMNDHSLSAFMYEDNNQINVIYENSTPSNTKEIEAKLGMAVTKVTMDNLINITKEQGQALEKFSKMTGNLHMQKPQGLERLTINSS